MEVHGGFHRAATWISWLGVPRWSGRHLVRSSKRDLAALWLKEGLVGRVSSSLALGAVGSTKDLCYFFSCFGNELENVRLFTYQLKCSVNWLSAKSVQCHSCLFFFVFPSVVSHCASLCLGCLRMCELFLTKRQWMVTCTLSSALLPEYLPVSCRAVAPVQPLSMPVYIALIFLLHSA